FLGFVNFYGKYISHLSARSVHLRSLTRDNVVFNWGKEHRNEWDDLVDCLTKAPSLAIFDPRAEHKISADASQSGLGAVLLQLSPDEWRPVAFASRVLTAAESRYSQIEKEALASALACEKFR